MVSRPHHLQGYLPSRAMPSTKGSSASEGRRVLFMTNAEAGQANVCLATAYSLQELGAEVHFASFARLRENVTTTLPGVRFHELQGKDMKDLWSEDPNLGKQNSPTIWNIGRFFRTIFRSIFPWSGPEFVEIYNSVIEILEAVEPAMCVIDPALNPALTACQAIDQPFIILSPNTIKDFALGAQPAWDQFAKYPCLASGFEYPIPWYRLPLNIWYVFVALWMAIFDSRRASIEKYVKDHTGTDVFRLGDLNMNPAAMEGIKVLVANRMEIEWDLKVIPSYIVPCGPIIRPARPVAEVDPEIEAWLDRGTTLYINLGSHVELPLAVVTHIAAALRQTFEVADSGVEGKLKLPLQVFWKLKKKDFDGDDEIRAVLGEYMDADRIRIVEWLGPEPSVFIQHRNIAVVANHGGANSFLEAVVAGKPQIIFPAWMDCFDFANRAEFLGIGLWPNKHTTGRYEVRDLTDSFLSVLVGPAAERMRANATRLAAICNEEPGREVAAKAILAEIEETSS